jgi:ABC-2 type transport system ATP-binding protein
MLSVRNLVKIFPGKRSWFGKSSKDFVAVNDISFDIGAGEVVGILGSNGAGKTTTLHMLLQILNPTSGSISYFGKDLIRYRREVMAHVAFASAYTNLPRQLTVLENLTIFAQLYGLSAAEIKKRISHYISLFDLEECRDKEVKSLSAGQQTRAMLAKSFLVHPKIILLDEPTASLDPDIARDVRSLIIKQQRELGLTVLLASHNMDEVATICNRVIVLSRGKIIDDDSPEKLAKSIARARVHLIITEGLEDAISYAQKNNLSYTTKERLMEISIDEQSIAHLFMELARKKVHYSSISIEKPTLEDYFLEIAHLSRKET